MYIGDPLTRKNVGIFTELEVWVCMNCNQVYGIEEAEAKYGYSPRFARQSHFCRNCSKGLMEKVRSDEILEKYRYEE